MTNAAPMESALARLYGTSGHELARQLQRWGGLAERFRECFGGPAPRFFSAPGRTEIGGNHTDHNHGKVLAAAVDLDVIAAAAPGSDRAITVYSEGYPQPFVVGLDDLSMHPDERGTTAALIRGIAARFRDSGCAVGGVQACIASDVPVGSGLSSSAAVEVLIGTILNVICNEARLGPERIAIAGQYAENVYFGKPCGLMDQIASAVGGIVAIDFEIPGSPRVERVEFDFAKAGCDLLVVDTGGSHADLTDDYAAIPREMKLVAAQFGSQVCREISMQDLLARLAGLRTTAGDRAILRALHFLQENDRVDRQIHALRKGNMQEFLRLVEESGDSSFRWLQNCHSGRNPREQGIALGLALAEGMVKEWGGACRVHGGGFAGTILVFLPAGRSDEFRERMEPVFGAGSVRVLRVRSRGSTEV